MKYCTKGKTMGVVKSLMLFQSLGKGESEYMAHGVLENGRDCTLCGPMKVHNSLAISKSLQNM